MGEHDFKPGDWVQVREDCDIPAPFRQNKPTRGRVESVSDEAVVIHVPIGGADVDEHSQSVPYSRFELEHSDA